MLVFFLNIVMILYSAISNDDVGMAIYKNNILLLLLPVLYIVVSSGVDHLFEISTI